MEGYTLPEFFTFNFFSVDRTLNAFKHNENAKLPEDVRLSNLVRYQAKAGLNEYENTLLAKSRGYDVWISDKEAYDWQQRTLKPCDWVVPLSKPKNLSKPTTLKRRCYTPDSKARQVISYWRERAERMNADLVRESFEIWLKAERNKKKEEPRREYLGEWNLSAQAQPIPLFTLSDFDIDDHLRCDEDPVIVIAESPLPPEIIEDGGNKWFPSDVEEGEDSDDVFECAQRTPVPIVIEDISDAETEEGGEELPKDEGFDELEDDALSKWTTDVERRERLKTILTGLHRAISACEKRGAVEGWKGKSTKERLQRLRAGWSTRKRKYDDVCDRLDEAERGIDRYRAHKATVKRLKLNDEEDADTERYDYDPVEERRLAFELCKSMSP